MNIGLGSSARAADVVPSCEAAARTAEQELGTPPGLLAAIGQVEASRRDPVTGSSRIWPWSVNFAGHGSFFATGGDARDYVGFLVSHGLRSVDVGCFQINLAWHPEAFASLAEAFDPQANARYAAMFLRRLYAATGRWDDAIARYHSAQEQEGRSYRSLVLAAWGDGAWSAGGRMPPADPVVIRMSTEAAGVRVLYGAIHMPPPLR